MRECVRALVLSGLDGGAKGRLFSRVTSVRALLGAGDSDRPGCCRKAGPANAATHPSEMERACNSALTKKRMGGVFVCCVCCVCVRVCMVHYLFVDAAGSLLWERGVGAACTKKFKRKARLNFLPRAKNFKPKLSLPRKPRLGTRV